MITNSVKSNPNHYGDDYDVRAIKSTFHSALKRNIVLAVSGYIPQLHNMIISVENAQEVTIQSSTTTLMVIGFASAGSYEIDFGLNPLIGLEGFSIRAFSNLVPSQTFMSTCINSYRLA